MTYPAVGPGVGEVDDEHQLDQDEDEAPDHAEVHPPVQAAGCTGRETNTGHQHNPETWYVTLA